jgi:hypothetical protein
MKKFKSTILAFSMALSGAAALLNSPAQANWCDDRGYVGASTSSGPNLGFQFYYRHKNAGTLEVFSITSPAKLFKIAEDPNSPPEDGLELLFTKTFAAVPTETSEQCPPVAGHEVVLAKWYSPDNPEEVLYRFFGTSDMTSRNTVSMKLVNGHYIVNVVPTPNSFMPAVANLCKTWTRGTWLGDDPATARLKSWISIYGLPADEPGPRHRSQASVTIVDLDENGCCDTGLTTLNTAVIKEVGGVLIEIETYRLAHSGLVQFPASDDSFYDHHNCASYWLWNYETGAVRLTPAEGEAAIARYHKAVHDIYAQRANASTAVWDEAQNAVKAREKAFKIAQNCCRSYKIAREHPKRPLFYRECARIAQEASDAATKLATSLETERAWHEKLSILLPDEQDNPRTRDKQRECSYKMIKIPKLSAEFTGLDLQGPESAWTRLTEIAPTGVGALPPAAQQECSELLAGIDAHMSRLNVHLGGVNQTLPERGRPKLVSRGSTKNMPWNKA